MKRTDGEMNKHGEMIRKINNVGRNNLKFELDDEQVAKYNVWVIEQTAKAVEMQKKIVKTNDPFYDVFQECWAIDEPYYGAIGGSDIFSFTHTSLGTCVKVKNSYTEETIDLTDYYSW